MLQVWVLLVCNSLHIMEQYRPSRSLHHHASTSSRAACLVLLDYAWNQSSKLIRESRSGTEVWSSSANKKTVKLCQNVWSMHGIQLLHSAQFLSLAVKVGHQYVPSTVPAHRLLPQAFLLVMQTAQSWSFQFATVPVLIGMIHLMWYVAQSPQWMCSSSLCRHLYVICPNLGIFEAVKSRSQPGTWRLLNQGSVYGCMTIST